MAATGPPLNPRSAWLIVMARVVEGLGENLRNMIPARDLGSRAGIH